MEELWKDMSLASTPAALQYHLSSPPAAAYLSHGYHPAATQPPRTPPHGTPHTASSLEFTYLGHPASSNSTSSVDDSSLHHMPYPFGRVAVQEAGAVGGDRRQRRIIKNRDSAARSRARKQAYTNELELERVQLRRENALLIQRQQELHARLAMAAEAPDRSTLQRSRSAPAP